jgi:N-acetylneuraminic acid mutarotase
VEEYDPATNTWIKKADLPTARSYLATSEVNGKIYAIGGWDDTGGAGGTVEQYDPVTDQWTRRADMLYGRAFLDTCVVNGKIYAVGGITNEGEVSIVEEYDPTMNSWIKKTDMPTAISNLSTCVVNGKIYTIGGSTWDNINSARTTLSMVEEYDPVTDTWTRKSDLPIPTFDTATVVVNGKIYAIGGRGLLTQSPRAEVTTLSTIMKYDPATDTWSTVGDMRVPRTALSASVVVDMIYVIGGFEVPVEPIATVEEYDLFPNFVDFNLDRILDINDLVILIENWGTDEVLCDIAPPPDGDGIVNILDLTLFMSYWQ